MFLTFPLQNRATEGLAGFVLAPIANYHKAKRGSNAILGDMHHVPNPPKDLHHPRRMQDALAVFIWGITKDEEARPEVIRNGKTMLEAWDELRIKPRRGAGRPSARDPAGCFDNILNQQFYHYDPKALMEINKSTTTMTACLKGTRSP